MKLEIAKFLTCGQTPAPILDCAGERLPTLKNFVFVVLKAGVERRYEDWNARVVLDEFSHWDAFCLKIKRDPAGNSISLLELKPPFAAFPATPFPVSIEVANLLPSCGVLTVGGAASFTLGG